MFIFAPRLNTGGLLCRRGSVLNRANIAWPVLGAGCACLVGRWTARRISSIDGRAVWQERVIGRFAGKRAEMGIHVHKVGVDKTTGIGRVADQIVTLRGHLTKNIRAQESLIAGNNRVFHHRRSAAAISKEWRGGTATAKD